MSRRLLFALMLVVAVLGGTAASASADRPPIVQLAEGNQAPSYDASSGVVGDLLAIHYGFPAEQNFRLRLRVASHGLARTRVITALDFDRDGVPDAAVDTLVRVASQAGNTGQPFKYYDLAGSGTTATCLVVPSSGTVVGTGTTTATDDGDSFSRVSIQAPQGLFRDEDLARYAPRLAAIQVREDTGAELDAIPAAAKSTARCGAGGAGWTLDSSKAIDRFPAGAPIVDGVTHDDPAGDAPSANADLTRVAVEPRTVTAADGDVVDGTNQTKVIHPADLAIDFAPGSSDRSTITYLWPETWAPGAAHQSPEAAVVTEPAAAGVKVSLFAVLPRTTRAAGSGEVAQCIQTPVDSGATPALTVVTLPTETVGTGAQAHQRLRIVLDALIGAETDETVRPDLTTYRFHTISDPGGLGGAIDHVPFLAGLPRDPTNASPLAVGCAGGAQVYEDRSFTVGTPQPTAVLTPSTTTPTRDQDVTFTATSNAPTKRCSLGQLLAWDNCTSLTQRYTGDATAYLSAYDANGAWNTTSVGIQLRNSPPTAAITKLPGGSPTGTDGSSTTTGGSTVSVPLRGSGTDIDGDPVAYAWTRDGVAASTSQDYTPVFSAPGTYAIVLTTSDGRGNSTTATLQVVVARSPAGDVSIERPARVVAGQPFDIRALVANDPHQQLTWSWDLDGDDATNYDTTHTTRELTGVVIPTASPSFLVRVRATDQGGRTGEATIALVVRRPNEAPPAAAFAVTPETGRTSGQVLRFDGSQSRLSDPDGVLYGPVGQTPQGTAFHWDFGDGTPVQTTSTASIDHTYAGSGQVTASLVVEDVRATPSTSSDPATQALRIAPGTPDANAPTAAIARLAPVDGQPIFAGRDVVLSAAASSAVAGHDPLRFTWDTDGDGSFETDTGVDPQLTFRPAAGGPLAVRARATDAFGSATASAPLTLDVAAAPDKAPTVALKGPELLTLTGASVSASYDASGSKGENLDPALTYRWDADGDGTFETTTGTTPTLETTFASAGVKTVGVRVTDAYANTATRTTTTTVRTPADVAAGCAAGTSFTQVTYANVRLRGCAQRILRGSAGPLYLLSATTRINGLDLVAGNASQRAPARTFPDCTSETCRAAQAEFNGGAFAIAFDPSDGTLRSNSGAALRAVGAGLDVSVFSGVLDVSLPDTATTGFSLGTPAGSTLGGFPLTNATFRFPAPGETSLGLDMTLPASLGGITGHATLRATATGGVALDVLRVSVGEVSVSKKLKLGELGFSYDRSQALWSGNASMTIPSPKALELGVGVTIQDNRFKSINGFVNGLNQPIAQAIYLQSLRAGVSVDPLDLTGGLSISAGPAVKNKAALSLDGDLRLRFPSAAANYYLFQLTGKLKLADFQLATGFAQFSSNGFIEAGGGIDIDVEIAYLSAQLSGWISPDAFNFDADAEVGVKLGATRIGLFGGHATLSTTGVAACGEIPVIDVGGGFGAKWGQSLDAFWGCDLSPYRTARPADAPARPTFGAIADGAFSPAAQRYAAARIGQPRAVNRPEGHLIEVPQGAEKALLTVHGTTGPPRVTVVDERGTVVLDTPADGSDVLTKKMLVQSVASRSDTQVLWKAPPAGKLYVLEQQGSAPVDRVKMALPAPKRTIRTTVSASGAQRTLRWSVTPALDPGVSLQLAEEGVDAGTQLAVTSKSAGSVRFTPQGGKAGRRVITGTLVTSGIPAEPRTVGSYTAPKPPVPPRSTRLRLVRSGSAVTADWSTPGRGPRTGEWRALVTVNGGTRKSIIATGSRRRNVRIPDVMPGDRLTVRLTAASPQGLEGVAREAALTAGQRTTDAKALGAQTPRAVRIVRRRGGPVTVTWRTGSSFVRGFDIRVRAGGRRVLLRAAAGDRAVVVRGLPRRGRVVATVTARRYGGGTTPSARGRLG